MKEEQPIKNEGKKKKRKGESIERKSKIMRLNERRTADQE